MYIIIHLKGLIWGKGQHLKEQISIYILHTLTQRVVFLYKIDFI